MKVVVDRCPAIEYPRLIRRVLTVRCSYEHIPEAIVADVSGMDIGDMLKVSAITPPEGVELVYESDFNIVNCFAAKKRG